MPVKSRHSAGFTLLEMLVSLTLLALIITMTLSAFVTLNRTSDRVAGVSQNTDTLLTLSRFLQHKITLAQPIKWIPEGFDQSPVMLVGNSEQLIWLSAMSPTQQLGGVHYLRLQLQADQTLTLDLLAYSDDQPDWQLATRVDLLTDVTRFRLQYRALEAEAWSDEWLNSEVLPDFVKIQLTQLTFDWPDQVIRVLQGGRR